MTARFTSDDAHFLAAADEASRRFVARVRARAIVRMQWDELEEIATAFDRAVRLAIAAHLSRSRRGAP